MGRARAPLNSMSSSLPVEQREVEVDHLGLRCGVRATAYTPRTVAIGRALRFHFTVGARTTDSVFARSAARPSKTPHAAHVSAAIALDREVEVLRALTRVAAPSHNEAHPHLKAPAKATQRGRLT